MLTAMLGEICCDLRVKGKQTKTKLEAEHLWGGHCICLGERCLKPDLEMTVDGGIIMKETLGPGPDYTGSWGCRHHTEDCTFRALAQVPYPDSKGKVNPLLDHSHFHPSLWEGKRAQCRHLVRSTGLFTSEPLKTLRLGLSNTSYCVKFWLLWQ